ncbi:MAG: hypothetical protein ABIU29_09510 [Chthoniobacterales bacterium]
MSSLQARLDVIRAETDQNRKNLRVAELVSELFLPVGPEPVIVGASAVEFYTEGAYVSGDVDVCFNGTRLPAPRERETVLAEVGESVSILLECSRRNGGPARPSRDLRPWPFAEARPDPLNPNRGPDRRAHPHRHRSAVRSRRWQVANILIATAWKNLVPLDRDELQRVAESSDYRIVQDLQRMIEEIEEELKE